MITIKNNMKTTNKTINPIILCIIGLVGSLLIILGSGNELLATEFVLIVAAIPTLTIMIIDLIHELRNK